MNKLLDTIWSKNNGYVPFGRYSRNPKSVQLKKVLQQLNN